jgi:uncharacterized membrane protein (UPF0127 family)
MKGLTSVKISYNGKIISTDIALANNFWMRLSGYMFRKQPHVAGILFEPAKAMQTTFMNFRLDIVFLTQENQVVEVLRNVKPWRHTWFYLKAQKALEMPAGVIPAELKAGDILNIIPNLA